jgi:IclR family acetate operon transcriptional repressor
MTVQNNRENHAADPHEQGPVTRTIARAVAILHTFDKSRSELGVTEIGQATGLDKSTVYRLLSALEQGGLIDQDPETTKYRLGLGLVRLAGLALQNLDLPRIARPYLEELAHVTSETVNLSLMTDEDKLIHVDSIVSPLMVRYVGWIGREMPLHAVAGGKVMMAHLPQEQLDRILGRGLARLTERTVIDPLQLLQELANIRLVGHGTDVGELEIGLSSVSAPIWNYEGRVVAVVSVSGPSSRLPEERLIHLGDTTEKTAGMVSRQLGYTLQR